ncbi:diguanylate cyclase/phosphodiesterase (GGDEF & EAL domains) with PAS/PAC sensor(s) [Geitlerinema sp. FC II]|nr:PAS domain S-box protein [Geitlerinema sp. CS-897]PPT07254.1 diguanylate cyclase/phosphodiesterase (GGDEF & EAL domains) with PAS/PAC sensor(s) [Geitlerinema sp. FC II]
MEDLIHTSGIEQRLSKRQRSQPNSPSLRVSQPPPISRIDLGKFFELSRDMMCAIGSDSHFKHLTAAWTTALGYTRQELQSRPWLEWVHPDDIPQTLEKINELIVLKTDKVSFKNRYRCRNGRYKWFSWEATFDEVGCVVYANVGDLGERPGCSVGAHHGTTTQFNTLEEHFRLLVDGVKDYAIYMLDKQGRVISWNAGAERINGWRAEEIIGESLEIFFPESSRDRHDPNKILAWAATAGRFEFENWRLRKDGSQFWAHVAVSALRDEDGQLLGYATITRDITTKKEQEEALQQAYDNLEQRIEDRMAELSEANARLREEIYIRRGTEEALRQSRERLQQQASELAKTLRELQTTQAQLIQTEKMSGLGQLVAGVAHEINNPVGFIHGNLEHLRLYANDLVRLLGLYQQHYPNPNLEILQAIDEIDLDFIVSDMPKLLASMNSGTQRIQKIVQSLRQFSRLDEAQYKEVDLHDGLESALLLLQHRLKASGNAKTVCLEKDYSLLPLVECYAGQLNQVFANTLENAIDAMRERERRLNDPDYVPKLRVQTRHLGDRVAVEISDNGIGMTEKVRSRAFDPFFTTKPVGQGTGLGLSTTYQTVVEKHGGTLSFESHYGRGTTLTLELPVCLHASKRNGDLDGRRCG